MYQGRQMKYYVDVNINNNALHVLVMNYLKDIFVIKNQVEDST